MCRYVPEPEVAKQEVAVHVFVPLDGGHAEDGVASVRAMWDRFRTLQSAGAPVLSGVPDRMPDALPVPPAYHSTTVAAVQSTGQLDQAILRRNDAFLNLSLLLGARPDRSWPGLRRRAQEVVGPLGAAQLGAVLLELGELPSGTPGELDLLEPEGGHEAQKWRTLRLLGRSGEDGRLGASAWSVGNRAGMPAFVRYLMYTTAIRYQWSVHCRLLDARATGNPALHASVRLPFTRDERPLRDPVDEYRSLKLAVSALWDSARKHLDTAESCAGVTLRGTPALVRDERFVRFFGQCLDDMLALHELVGPVTGRTRAEDALAFRAGTERTPPTGPAEPADRPVRVLVVCDEWFPARGGLSTFNRSLCIALAAAGADVRVLVVSSDASEREDAAGHGVRLVDADGKGLGREAVLLARPRFPDGFVPDLVVGHGRVTGAAAAHQVRDNFPEALRLQFLHVEPDQAERNKPGREPDMAVRAEERHDRELELCRGALPVAVGPRLERMVFRERRTPRYSDLAPPVRIDPGFDGGKPVPPPGPGETPLILVMGRLEDDPLKGLDIACRAVGLAVPEQARPGLWELRLRGTPELESEAFAEKAAAWVANPAVDVVPRTYSSDRERIENDVARASLVLMPSRAEAFGLVGLEAIAAGIPVLVSGRSGLGELLLEQQLFAARQAVVEVGGTTQSRRTDVRRWQQAIHAVMWDLRASFERAAELREEMAARVSWARAAEAVLDCARLPGAARRP